MKPKSVLQLAGHQQCIPSNDTRTACFEAQAAHSGGAHSGGDAMVHVLGGASVRRAKVFDNSLVQGFNRNFLIGAALDVCRRLYVFRRLYQLRIPIIWSNRSFYACWLVFRSGVTLLGGMRFRVYRGEKTPDGTESRRETETKVPTSVSDAPILANFASKNYPTGSYHAPQLVSTLTQLVQPACTFAFGEASRETIPIIQAPPSVDGIS